MTRRKRGKGSETNDGTPVPEKKPTHQGIPFAALEEAARIYPDKIPVRLQRKNPLKGWLSTIGNEHMTVAELAKIEEFLKEKYGGGDYFIDARHPENFMAPADPIPKFYVQLHGLPKPTTGSDFGIRDRHIGPHQMKEFAEMGNLDFKPEEFENLPHHVKALSVPEQAAYIVQLREQRARMDPTLFPGPRGPVVVQTQDKGLERHADFVSADLLAERQKLAEERARHDAEVKALRDRLDQVEKDRVKAEYEAREREWRAKFEALESRLNAPQQKAAPTIDPQVMLALIPVAGTLLQTVIQSGTQKTTALAEQQTKAVQMQMESMNTMLAKAAQPPPDSLKGLLELVLKLAPIASPLVTSFLESKSPKAQAAMMESMVDTQLTSLSMIAEMIGKVNEAQGEEKWYTPLFQNVLGMLQHHIETTAEARKAQLVPHAQQQQPAQPKPAQRSQGEQIASMVMQHPQFPADMKQEGWFHVIAQLHDSRNPQQVAEFTLKFINELIEADKMPATLAEWENDPIKSLERMISVLPVAQNKAYCQQFLKEVEELLTSTDTNDGEGDEVTEEGGDEEEAPEVVDTKGETVPFNLNQQQFEETVKPKRQATAVEMRNALMSKAR